MEAGAEFVIGCDEVGRGAIAGPVAVGVCIVDIRKRVPRGLRDSKLLSEKVRESLAPPVAGWAVGSAIGMSSNDEIDRFGLTIALGLAGSRAVIGLLEQGFELGGSALILDGKFDYLTPALAREGVGSGPRVVTRIKADMDCASVSGASVLAKVARDRLMIDHHEQRPHYGWVSNKGYGSASHWAAIDQVGPSELHRHTWLRTPSLFDLGPSVDDQGSERDVEAAFEGPSAG
ncbi:ribonuclease HII [Naasia lichenicola]|uniref:Ribonuclease n=2 Tax=Naasia lichenicola TaxID=2565933 RepID=A0A4S4FNG4_9MICO|nr:ribonuclease HII [Naasia lichenicola]